MPIIGSGGILPGESYLLGWGFISTFSSALILWRTTYNLFFNRKKVKKAREAIHIVMSCFMICKFFFKKFSKMFILKI